MTAEELLAKLPPVLIGDWHGWETPPAPSNEERGAG